jgi:hypothetical protein
MKLARRLPSGWSRLGAPSQFAAEMPGRRHGGAAEFLAGPRQGASPTTAHLKTDCAVVCVQKTDPRARG